VNQPTTTTTSAAETGEIPDEEVLGEIERLTAENRLDRDSQRERRLLDLRIRASALHNEPGLDSWPRPVPDLFAETSGLLEIDARELNAEVVNSGVKHHGALVVRGLFSPDHLARLIPCIDQVFAGADNWIRNGGASGTESDWFDPLSELDGSPSLVAPKLFGLRGGGVPAADSPRGFFEDVEVLTDLGLIDLVAHHFGERPAVSPYKTALRRVAPGAPTGWHQDGSFLGDDIRTLNLWASFSDCGRDAPGLELVPRRFDSILDSFDMDDELVAAILEETPPVLPEFEPGDAVFFDEFFLHRTGVRPSMTKVRYGLESWFFAPSHYPDNAHSILL
jgi:hypothetical protein